MLYVMYTYVHKRFLWAGAYDVMFIVIENGLCNTSSNPRTENSLLYSHGLNKRFGLKFPKSNQQKTPEYYNQDKDSSSSHAV